MSLQGPILLVAEEQSGDISEALSAAGAFPIIDTSWADAPAAFMSVKPCAIVIAEPNMPPSESSARMLCLQTTTANGPMIPVVARVGRGQEMPVPIALAVDADAPSARLVTQLRTAMRVRALHATVLRRIETHGAEHGTLPALPVGDPLEESTVMIVGRGPAYPALSAAVGERFGLLGALSVETAVRHLETRDIDGIVVCDGQRNIDAMLTELAPVERYRNIPVTAIGEAAADLAECLPNLHATAAEPKRIVTRMIPHVRLHAFESRLKRMIAALDSGGVIDADTGLLSVTCFWQELGKAVADSGQAGHALSLARFSFDGDLPPRAASDRARFLARVMRESDFGCRDQDGAILVAFGQTDLANAHVVARRIAAALRNGLVPRGSRPPSAHVTLATLKGTDTPDSLLARVYGGEAVAAE